MVRSTVKRRSDDCVLICFVLARAVRLTGGSRGLCVWPRKTSPVAVGRQWHSVGLDRFGSGGGLGVNEILV